MWLSFLKKIKKNKDLLNSFKDISDYQHFTNREIYLNNLTAVAADEIDNYIRFINKCDSESGLSIGERTPIKLFINSYGGNLDAALIIMDSIKISKTPVYTFNTGCVFKESFLVYLAGHKRYAYPNSKFNYSTSIFVNSDNTPDESNFYTYNLYLENLAKDMKIFFLDKITLTETQYDKYSEKTWWFSAEEAYKIHICNEILRIHYLDIKKKGN